LQELTRNVQHLTSPDHSVREAALLELSKKREDYPDLAPMLWHSFGTITALLQEIIAIYPALSPPTLTGPASNRVCNALALLQCVASHPETRSLFLTAHIPLYLYPFLNTAARSKPFEYLRLTSLGVIGALVKVRCSDRVADRVKAALCASSLCYLLPALAMRRLAGWQPLLDDL
jgi:CCR4-NOT transcription complex subunit 9